MVQIKKRRRKNIRFLKPCLLICFLVLGGLLISLMVSVQQFYPSAQISNTPKVATPFPPKANLPSFHQNIRTQNDKQNQRKCRCVDCQEDELCGGLWKGTQDYATVRDVDLSQKDIHIVISHCREDLAFIETLTKGFRIASIHIISKCSQDVRGAPKEATIQSLPNFGRCDHSYAYYITSVLPEKIKERNTRKAEIEDIIVVFLKDNVSEKNHHQPGQWVSFEYMIRLASSENGFACGILPGASIFQPNYEVSAYYDLETLKTFRKRNYKSRNLYETDGVEFQSVYPSMSSFYDSLNAGPIPNDVVPVCYGGIFAASMKSILAWDTAVWKAAEKKLTRGDNIGGGTCILS